MCSIDYETALYCIDAGFEAAAEKYGEDHAEAGAMATSLWHCYRMFYLPTI